jgi:TolA-binding protein
MKYLFILFLFGCGVSAQKIDKDIEFEELMKQVDSTNAKSATVLEKATKKEKQLVTNAVATITQMQNDINELKSIVSIVKIDTIYIHDTIQIKEKKNFWGKVKTDTTN